MANALHKHLARIGRKGGEAFKPGKERMTQLARLSWSPESRAKRLRKQTSCQNGQTGENKDK